MSSEFDSMDEPDGVDRPASPEAIELFDALSNARRCAVLRVLDEQPSLSEHELAARVLEREETVSATTEQVHVSLRHRHLPKLDDGGIVDYDPDNGVVDCGQFFDVARATLEEAHTRCSPTVAN